MFEIRTTDTYNKWMTGLRDIRAKARINTRIRRMSIGLAGDVKSVGEGVFETRIDYGPGSAVLNQGR